MSGDAASGTSVFNCDKSTIEIQSSSSVYSTAPMFFVTNTQSKINLEECTFKYGSNIFLKAEGTSEWGNSGSNGGVVTLTLTDQDIEGDFIVDGYSGLTLNLISSTIKGKINTANTAAKIAITLDSDSKITLTGNSYYTSLVNEKTDGSNLINGTYKWTVSEEKQIQSSSNNNNQGGSPNGQPPNGQSPSDMPNGQSPNGQPPSDMPNGQPPNGQPPSDMPNGQPPSDMPNGQPPNNSQKNNPDAEPNNEYDDDPEDIEQYIKNNSGKLNNFVYLTLMLLIVTIC